MKVSNSANISQESENFVQMLMDRCFGVWRGVAAVLLDLELLDTIIQKSTSFSEQFFLWFF